MITIQLGDKQLDFEDIKYVGATSLVARHPETGVWCYFYASGVFNPKVLHKLNAKLKGGEFKKYKGVNYYELEGI